ncbi:carbohydrate kinase family protein [Chitinophaga vietnamensis]|uniref:carbohydrate kinase family protein n=1 Tax=Chitinophaga vietnamensis TaxID=2593957 RepID=UPI0011783416|nr:carbohydrate kinase [Chitinophaga vietnamensis]
MSDHIIACFGEILWDLLPGKELPGGAPMNVAYHLQRLGNPVAMITRIGADDYGRRLLALMEQYQLDTRYVQQDTVHETGKVHATVTPEQEMQYDIVYPSAWDFIRMEPLLEALLQHPPSYLVFGSLSTRNEISRQTLEHLLGMKATKVLDINLRAPHYHPDQVSWLLEQADILKLNEHELALLANWYDYTGPDETVISAMAANFGLHTIILTLGSKGCMLYTGGQFYYESGHVVTVADTIGSGDAFLAGYLHSIIKGDAPQQCLHFANALGAVVAGYHGGCPAYALEEVIAMQQRHQ